MPLSWNEIRDRSLRFSKEWSAENSEDAEAKSFWDGFFEIFGITRRRLATFEQKVKKIDGKDGFIDLLWKGVLLVEHKSRGKDLDRAYEQAVEYFPNLQERDLPKYVLVSDFARFRLYDLEERETHEFVLKDLHKNVRLFGFMAGYQVQKVKPEDPANIRAAELMGRLYDRMKAVGYEGHPLQVYLVRLLFCLFAEDTGIFEKKQFQEFLETRTAEDGSDLGDRLATLFHVLNAPEGKRLKNLDETLAAFPYVNGRLFEESLPPASFDAAMRRSLLDCCGLTWSRISPAVFGSLFQSVMDKEARRNLGAHYTRETNILRLIKPLFLDELWEEFERSKASPVKLRALHDRIEKLAFLDPACGCGNFLVIAYRELRLLELEILKLLYKKTKERLLNIGEILKLDVDRFHGIEVEEFPSQIAQVALWMTDHQMNLLVSEEFGQYYRRLPLRKAPNILCGSALGIDWRTHVRPENLSFILGNPPFIGKQHQKPEQKAEMERIFARVEGAGVLDYVAAWYEKAAEFMKGTPIRAAFVSTNSICQGEQAGVLWQHLIETRGVAMNFAHRTFQWSSEARGKAAVHCVIVGFATHETKEKTLFDYATPQSDPHARKAARINPYLVDAPIVWIENRRTPISPVPEIVFGSMPNDGGNLLLSEEERAQLVAAEPGAARWIRPFLGAEEFLNAISRWCLWLDGIEPGELKALPRVAARVKAVKEYREASKREATRRLASFPTRFGEVRQPKGDYLMIPSVSSEKRIYIPIGFMPPETIGSNLVLMVPDATPYHLGILQSAMHMAWVRHVCGRMKSDYRYSNGIVYNNFPWPEPSEKASAAVAAAAETVLAARKRHPKSSLADLYDPVSTPPDLAKAHIQLDRAVDAAYRPSAFGSETERVAFLFERYESVVRPLLPPPKRPRTKGGRREG